MGVRERREREQEALRRKILDAAREMFVEDGYHSVSMRRLAERIEYSPTTIYLYFKDKAELFNSLCEETFAELDARLAALARRHEKGPLAFMREGLRGYVEFGLRHPHHYAITFILHPKEFEHLPFEQSAGKRVFDHLLRAVEACVRAGLFRQDLDVAATAQALWAAAHGVTSLLIAHGDGFPFVSKRKLIDQTVDTMLRGLSP